MAILLRARLAARKDGSRLPIAALFLSSSAAALLCLVVREVLGPHGYAVFALSIAAAFVARPLTAADLRIARALAAQTLTLGR